MEEVKILIEAIAGLPDLALWVIAMYFFFKLAVVGSIYGVIRFITMKMHDWAITKRVTVKQETCVINLDNHLITCSLDDNIGEFRRLLERMKFSTGQYIHSSDIARVNRALDMLMEKEGKK